MWSLKEFVIFLAGASTFHTLSHMLIGYMGILPINFLNITWDQRLNFIAIIANAGITALLFWWAYTL
jgi:hypothetical protein